MGERHGPHSNHDKLGNEEMQFCDCFDIVLGRNRCSPSLPPYEKGLLERLAIFEPHIKSFSIAKK